MESSPLKRPKIACIGAAHWDRLASLSTPLKMQQLNTVSTQRVPSGASLNAAMDLACLGFPVKLLSILGEDQEGRELVRTLNQTGIDTEGLELIESQTTGWATTLVDDDGSIQFSLADLSIYSSMNAEWLMRHINRLLEWPYWIVDTHVSSDCLDLLCERAADCSSLLYAAADSAATIEMLRPHLSTLEGIFLNRTEAVAFTSVAIIDLNDAFQAVGKIIEEGARFVALTLDKDGVVYQQAGQNAEHVPTPPADVVNVSGAGDAFTAGTIASFSLGNTAGCAVRHGIETAKATVESFSNVNPALTPDLLEELFAPTESAA
jgi:pseudouridine kinase